MVTASDSDGAAKNRNGVTGSKVASIPFEMSDNHIALRVRVNGSKPLVFVLDTGSSACVIDEQEARALKLRLEGAGLARGEGEGAQEVRYVRNVKFDLSGLAVSVPIAPVTKLNKMDRKYSGLLGYDFFARYVIEVDYDNRVLNIYDPKGFDFSGGGTILNVTIEHGLPYVLASLRISGHPAVDRRLLLDTGSSQSVNDPLVGLSRPYLDVVGSGAVGRNFYTHLGRIDEVDFGGMVFREVLGISGGVPLIGEDLLHRFNAIYDYTRSRVILRPNRYMSEPFVMDLQFDGKIPRFRTGVVPARNVR